jgi:hypothetical protein
MHSLDALHVLPLRSAEIKCGIILEMQACESIGTGIALIAVGIVLLVFSRLPVYFNRNYHQLFWVRIAVNYVGYSSLVRGRCGFLFS